MMDKRKMFMYDESILEKCLPSYLEKDLNNLKEGIKNNVSDYYQAMDVFVLPSFPLPGALPSSAHAEAACRHSSTAAPPRTPLRSEPYRRRSARHRDGKSAPGHVCRSGQWSYRSGQHAFPRRSWENESAF